MPNYDFTENLSPIDFELLTKDLLEAELEIRFESFREGKDGGIDLRHASRDGDERTIVQCKRYGSKDYSNLKSKLKLEELPKIKKLKPSRYILATSVGLSSTQSDELKGLLAPFIESTDDIYGRDRLNSLLAKHEEVERRHNKLWIESTGVLETILKAGTHVVSREELERTIQSAKIYVRNESFDEALRILKSKRVLIISGIPGIGKTTLARMLLLHFHELKFDVVKIESDISEARELGFSKRPRFYYYDDFLGQTAIVDKLNKNEDQKILDLMRSVQESKSSVMVLTTREYVLNQAKLTYEKFAREKFDHRTCVIDLSKYSRRIRAEILYNHLHFSDLPSSHLIALVADRAYINIVDHENYSPRLVEYLTSKDWIGDTSPPEYVATFISNLNNPVEIWDHAFSEQLSQAAQDLLLVLTTFQWVTSLDDLQAAYDAFHSIWCSRHGLPHPPADFRHGLKELEGTFIDIRKISNGTIVEFGNPSIRDFMQNRMLGGSELTFLLENSAFFEQASWFADILIHDRYVEVFVSEDSKVGLQKLDENRTLIAKKLIDLFTATPRAVYQKYDSPKMKMFKPGPPRRVGRLATLAELIAGRDFKIGEQFIDDKLAELEGPLTARNIDAQASVRPTVTLHRHGYLRTSNGDAFLQSFKARSTSSLDDIDEYEILQSLSEGIPDLFTQSELDDLTEGFTSFADGFAEDTPYSGINNPEHLHEDADRIEALGKFFKADIDEASKSIRDFADNKAGDLDPPDDWGRGGGHSSGGSGESCSDGDLDSMFNTLKD
jgi:hypothetical protein